MASESPTRDEVEVAEILLHLPEMILTGALNSRVVFTWGKRRKRTDPREQNDKKRANAVVVSQPTQPPPPPLEVEAESTSPASTLFPWSESDSMGNRSKRRSSHHHRRIKKKRKEWLHHLTELTQQKAQLQIAIQNVRSYFDKQSNLNALLRARKEELMIKPDSKKGQSSSLVSEFHNHCHHRNQARSEDRTVQIQSSDPSPLELFDLNAPPLEECHYVDACQPSDSAISERDRKRVEASEARRQRIQINRSKNKHRSPKR